MVFLIHDRACDTRTGLNGHTPEALRPPEQSGRRHFTRAAVFPFVRGSGSAESNPNHDVVWAATVK